MPDERPEHKHLFDFFIHEAETVNTRADWFLIFHAILFEAFLAADAHDRTLYRLVLGTLGCVASYVWLTVGIRQAWDLRHLSRNVCSAAVMDRATASLFADLFAARRGAHQPRWIRWASSTPAFCIVLPLACLLVWLVFASTAIEGRFNWRALVGVVMTLVLSTILSILVQKWPDDVPIASVQTQTGDQSAATGA